MSDEPPGHYVVDMRADQAIRHNAAVGAILGLAVADSLTQRDGLPAPRAGGAAIALSWGATTERALAHAEAALKGHPIDMALSAAEVVPVAIWLAGPAAAPPLLADADAALMCRIVSDALDGRPPHQAGSIDSEVGDALRIVASATSFASAVEQALGNDRADAARTVGPLAGMRWGPAGIPTSWATDLHGPVGANTYRPRQLRRLAERLLGFEAPAPPEPRWSNGPREVAPKLWLSNLPAVPSFIRSHPQGAVISLCPTRGGFDDHAYRREFSLHDASGRDVNPALGQVVDEVLAAIAAFHDESRDVLVHCHHGASRTGLILRAWLMQELELGCEDATVEAQARWPTTSTWNAAFTNELRRRELRARS